MKLTQIRTLFDRQHAQAAAWFGETLKEIREAISAVNYPVGSDKFTINPKRKGNGVVPIKKSFAARLESLGWKLEDRLPISTDASAGPIDATKFRPEVGTFAVEWETGNISSSHRAINKLALGILQGKLVGGLLVLPSQSLYRFLTDRIGSFREIEPYFPVWEALETAGRGYLGVIEVEHDDESESVPLIPKGTDGRSKKKRSKKKKKKGKKAPQAGGLGITKSDTLLRSPTELS